MISRLDNPGRLAGFLIMARDLSATAIFMSRMARCLAKSSRRRAMWESPLSALVSWALSSVYGSGEGTV